MYSTVLFLAGILVCSYPAFGEWYHPAIDSGRLLKPDVIMSMTNNVESSSDTGTFYYNKGGTTEMASISRTQAPVDNIRAVDGPDYVRPGLYFDGNTHIDLGSHSDSCFDNFGLCPDGWTMGFWINIEDIATTQIVMDSGANHYKQGWVVAWLNSGKLQWYLNEASWTCRFNTGMAGVGWQYTAMTVQDEKCTFLYKTWEGVSEFTESVIVRSQQDSPVADIDRVVIGANHKTFALPGTFSIDELAVWYGAVDISTMTFIYNYQLFPLGYSCDTSAECTNGMDFTSCTRNEEWGSTDKYCQCIGDTTLTPIYEECQEISVSGRCPRISKDHIRQTVLTIEANKRKKGKRGP